MDKQKVIISVGLIAVEIILLITGFGEISNGSLSITILHIPVILAAILLGLPYGGILGGIFGIGTMVAASGYGAETLDHQFVNPVLSIVPRLLIALAAWFVYRFLKKHMDDDTISSECIAGGSYDTVVYPASRYAGRRFRTFGLCIGICQYFRSQYIH